MSTTPKAAPDMSDLQAVTHGLNMLLDTAEYFRADTPTGARVFQRCVDAVLARIAKKLPPPEPAPKPERPADWMDEPADFQHEIPIGEICGATVYGLRMWEQKGGQIWRYAARAELNGLQIGAYPPALGDEREYINIDTGDGLDSVGDLWWSEVQRLVELAQMPGDPLGQLMAMARAFVAEAPAADRRAA